MILWNEFSKIYNIITIEIIKTKRSLLEKSEIESTDYDCNYLNVVFLFFNQIGTYHLNKDRLLKIYKWTLFNFLQEIVDTHALLVEYQDIIAPDSRDRLNELLDDLGEVPSVAALASRDVDNVSNIIRQFPNVFSLV